MAQAFNPYLEDGGQKFNPDHTFCCTCVTLDLPLRSFSQTLLIVAGSQLPVAYRI